MIELTEEEKSEVVRTRSYQYDRSLRQRDARARDHERLLNLRHSNSVVNLAQDYQAC